MLVLFLIFIIFGFAYISSVNRRSEEAFLGFGSELDSVATEPNTKIAGVRNTGLPLREYCMMSSYNTALTGTKVNLDMVVNVLKRGCRFIDLEIYYIGNKPVVGYSTDIKDFNLQVDNTIPLGQVLNKISLVGFSETPNSNDPIFINLRVKTSKAELYNKIASTLEGTVGPRLYRNKGTNASTISAPLSNFMGKIVILIDDAIEVPQKNDLSKYANLVFNRNGVRSYTAPMLSAEFITPPRIKDDGKSTDVTMLKIVIPAENENSDMKKFVNEYGTQVLFNRFYQPDDNLKEMERVFSDIGSAFVPISQMLKYFKTTESK
jgi:hypothetical protein